MANEEKQPSEAGQKGEEIYEAGVSEGFEESRADRRFFGHPIGLLNLFGTELCERFSYYGMRAILLFYIYASVADGGVGLEHSTALIITSLFGSFVYLVSILGGWLADRVFGPYKGVLYGGIIITAGHIVLGLPLAEVGLFVALFLIVLGTGLLKPNVSVMVGELYDKEDPRRQGGFSLLVMSINIGSFFSPLIVGYVSTVAGYHTAFLIPAFAMFVALLIYVIMGRTTLKGIGRQAVQPLTDAERRRWGFIGAAGIVTLLVVLVILNFAGLLSPQIIGDSMPIICTIIAVIVFIVVIRDKNNTAVDRSRVFAYIPIFLAAAAFWAIAEQQSTTVAMLADTRVDNDVAGFEVPASWYASINPLVIILLSPVFAFLWTKLGTKQPSGFVKMAIGLAMAFCGFAILGVAFSASGGALVSPLWVIAGMSVMTIGELLISPIGLSATTLLSPPQHMSKMMSLWFISNALGQGVIAITIQFFDSTSPEGYYFAFAGVALALGFVLLIMSKKLQGMTGGIR